MSITSSGVRHSSVIVALVSLLVVAVTATHGDVLYIGGTYADNSHVYSFDTEGPGSTATVLVSNQPGYIRALDVDTSQSRLYWANDPAILGSYVGSSNLAGGSVSTVGVAGDVFSLAVHPYDSQVYFGSFVSTGGTPRVVNRMEPDGSGLQQIISAAGTPYALALDSSASKMYWADGHNTIRRCDLDGQLAEDVITGLAGIYDMDLDESLGLLYWSSPTGVFRAPVDGSAAPQQILTGTTVRAIALSPSGGTVYYGDNVSSVYRMDSDGSDPAYVISVYNPVAIAVLPEPATLALLATGGIAILRRWRK